MVGIVKLNFNSFILNLILATQHW